MERKIALAVDGSVHCGCAVRYAAAMSAVVADLHYVLLHVQPAVSQYLTEEADRKPGARKALQALMKANQEASTDILEKVRRLMIQNGVADDRIETCSRRQVAGVAEDILEVCGGRSYDAVVVGRRGVTYLQELITGSVTANLLEHTELTPVWMVDDDVPNTRVALAADGSANSLRALDHLAFMLGGQPDARIHLLHVKPRLGEVCPVAPGTPDLARAEAEILEGDRACLDRFYQQALEALERNGLSHDQLSLQTIGSRLSVAGTLREAARKGGYGTLVVGRRGLRKGLFTGSVSRKMIQKAARMAVWLVP